VRVFAQGINNPNEADPPPIPRRIVMSSIGIVAYFKSRLHLLFRAIVIAAGIVAMDKG
jgi:hypothetical protein